MTRANRREFLKRAAAGLAMAIGSPVLAAQEESPAGLPVRPLGKTGEKVSIVGMGGWHIGSIPETEGIAIMHEAIDEGMNFFDNSWCYHMGGSEKVMGKALSTGGRRDKIFLMTKNCGRDYQSSLACLEDSLKRLKTDHVDLWQFHEINYAEDPKWLIERGMLKAALEAKKAGKVRYIGFTGHKDIDHHLGMLATPADWDTAQMPTNLLDPHYRSFQEKVVPECNRRNIGVIGMKALSAGHIPDELGFTAEVCRRYALSLPISTLVCGITSRKELRQDLAVARNYKPLTEAELRDLLADTKAPGSKGEYERFKTTARFDHPYHRKQHGL
ncbi:MAG: aldo/keto reductase [Planctomycetota bacterium]